MVAGSDILNERILFVTGRLAEPALRELLPELAREFQFDYEVKVLGISVAALMHVDWVCRKLSVDQSYHRVVMPGWCQGELNRLTEKYGSPFELGPKDLYDLPVYFGRPEKKKPDLSTYNIEILAEINHAPRLTDQEILEQSLAWKEQGADLIDLGCIPGDSWQRIGEVTRMLCDAGLRVSVDSFEQSEVTRAVEAGAELVLSCNQTNLSWLSELAKENGAEVVAIPDTPEDWSSLERTVEHLTENDVQFRIDPILEPIGFGFAGSLARYYQARRQWPEASMMMGIGNLTELSEVDSAGINFLLAGICEELNIYSVLTTEVINWCRSAVKEFDLARRLMRYSLERNALPKHLDSNLVMLRDTQIHERGEEALLKMASQIKDPNFRIFAERGELHIMNRDGYWHGTDPFDLYEEVIKETAPPDSSHAFYLGYELAKAVTALTLGKQYTQDQALNWGCLTLPEKSRHER